MLEQVLKQQKQLEFLRVHSSPEAGVEIEI